MTRDGRAVWLSGFVVQAFYDHRMSSQHRSPEPPHYTGPPWPVAVCAAVVVVGLLASGVVLAEAGWDSGQIVGMLMGFATVAGVLLTALGSLMGQHRDLVVKQDDQSDTLSQIAWNTNGNLKRLINEAVANALQDQEIRQAKPSTTSDGQQGNLAA